MTTAFPLAWPVGRPRTPTGRHRMATFNKKVDNGRYTETKNLTVADGIRRIQSELDRLGARQYVLSSNIETRLDGLPRSGQREPDDPGVALYFQLNGKPHCLPCDSFTRVADNMAAIAKHIEATRAIERYGVANLAEMFAGFAALPAPHTSRHWSEVLGVPRSASIADIEAAYRSIARTAHPDRGGSDAAMSELNQARDAARKDQS